MTSLPPADHDPNRRAEGDPPPDPESTELTGPGAPPARPPPGGPSTTPGETPPSVGSSVFPISAGLPDRYQLTAEIARGAMGVVLRGRDSAFGRDIAVKVLLSAHKDKREL